MLASTTGRQGSASLGSIKGHLTWRDHGHPADHARRRVARHRQTPRYDTFPAPVLGDGEAVVTVTAAELKPSDGLMASGVHYAPAKFPQIVGLDGVGRLPDGTRVAFFGPQPPYGGMAEQALVRPGMWLPVPDGIDDVTAAAVTNPGMAAWKTLLWEGELAAGQAVLVLGATGTSGRIANQLARRHGARVVAAGRNQHVLDQLLAHGADAAIKVDRPRDELAAAVAAEGPYDLIEARLTTRL